MKTKVKVITDCDGYSIDNQVDDWVTDNPHVNVVSIEMTPGSFTTLAIVAIIYNYDN